MEHRSGKPVQLAHEGLQPPDAHAQPATAGSPPRAVLERRMASLLAALRQSGPHFDTALIIDRINQYYFTGTMQDGLLTLRRDGTVRFFIRKSVSRARLESPLEIVEPMSSYRDMLQLLPTDLGSVYIETETMPVAVLERLRKHFTLSSIHPLEGIVSRMRSIKDEDELALMRESGRQHDQLLRRVVPGLLREGISEAELMGELYAAMIRLGHHGVSRFSMFQMEMIAGQVCFGESAIYPTLFNGPGGSRGLSAAVPALGSRERCLRRGDLVFADIGYGVGGYHTDKTQVYSFGAPPPELAVAAQQGCLNVLRRTSERLTVGAVPATIYQTVMASLPPVLAHHFMGYGKERVQFLGHGIGLQIDEQPVIARGFHVPLEAGMVFAIEPKCGLPGIGMVGAEETFQVTPDGPVCLTGGASGIIVV